MVHPLWDATRPAGLLADGMAASTSENLQTLDTFNLLRRPAWAYQELGKQA